MEGLLLLKLGENEREGPSVRDREMGGGGGGGNAGAANVWLGPFRRGLGIA